MNTKRQTIWLVSMLSLMVVLSAYYLFTDDISQINEVSNAVETQNIIVDTKETTPDAAQKTNAGITSERIKTSTTKTDTKVTDTKVTDTKATDSKVTESKAAGKITTGSKPTDAQVLKQIQTKKNSGADFFIEQQMKRDEEFAKQTEKLMTIIADTKKAPEDVAKAQNDLQMIGTKTEQINFLEEVLAKDYPNVMIKNDTNKYIVFVQSDKLEKSQAVSIVDLVMNELKVGPEKVGIEMIP